jgi:DMSO/TMAO reductase YedYZ heme-binding membrane subunit
MTIVSLSIILAIISLIIYIIAIFPSKAIDIKRKQLGITALGFGLIHAILMVHAKDLSWITPTSPFPSIR